MELWLRRSKCVFAFIVWGAKASPNCLRLPGGEPE